MHGDVSRQVPARRAARYRQEVRIAAVVGGMLPDPGDAALHVDNVVHVRDLHATMLHLLGIDHHRLTVKYQGLDVKLTGVEPARVVKDIIA